MGHDVHRATQGGSILRPFQEGRCRQTEVENLHAVVLVHQDILGLEVPVDDPLSVRRRQRAGRLHCNVEQFLGGQRSVRENLPQALSLHQLHRDVRDGSLPGGMIANFVDDDDVRMVKSRGRARLLLESLQCFTVTRPGLGQDFNGDFAAQPAVPRSIHISHRP